MIQEKNLQNTALVFRSLSLFLILYQIRLIAADLADSAVFTASIVIAFAAAVFLKSKIVNAKIPGKRIPAGISALVIIALVPWIARSIIALPGLLIRPSATASITITLDSLLLNLDRNNFVSLFPFYWTAVTTWFSFVSRKFLRCAIIADAVILLILYCIASTADIAMYKWPITMIIVFGSIVFLQTLALLFSMPKKLRLRSSETIPAILAIFILVILSGILFLGPSQKHALDKGGGLLEPKLFSFDFSKFLKLDSETSMGNDLIMIIKRDFDVDHILHRRLVLSGYNRKQGFYRLEDLDEEAHPQRLPAGPLEMPAKYINEKNTVRISQEYFLVNFDASAFIGMNQPIAVTPYENWDASSFKSAFMTESLVSNADLRDLYNVTQNWPDEKELGLSAAEYKIYTNYGGDERIQAFAQEITQDYDLYCQKIMMIYNRLKYGEYRYSLKPGIAPDGDQLSWFLFNTKKGYCSYYAFAMTLLLRSLGIPARTAAGFYIDPDTNTFNYYPVRSDMAHAWVEVLFPDYGWIEFDPTTENLAIDEELNFSTGIDSDNYEKLLSEILDNRWKLRVKENNNIKIDNLISPMVQTAKAIIKNYWALAGILILIIANTAIRFGYYFIAALHSNVRKKTIYLWKHCLRRLHLAGIKHTHYSHESELAEYTQIPAIYSMYVCAAAARFAPEFTIEEFKQMHNHYLAFSKVYGQNLGFLQKISSWILPVMILLMPTQSKKSKTLPILILLFLLGGSAAKTQTSTMLDADTHYKNAMASIYAENWEQAIDKLKTGGKEFPNDIRFPWTLGNLYFDRSLYNLAWDVFKKAEIINSNNAELVNMLAYTAGLLNKNYTSVEYYQKAIKINPENKEAIGDLGWMLYKVHRLSDAEKLITGAVDLYGERADFAMTLGTIYSVMYNYEKSKHWYQKAINMGTEIGDTNFVSVAHYNLSILESRFYKYDLSMNETNASLNSRTRASGLLARGELYMRMLELKKSQSDYQSAYELDTSPLAKLSLAQIYQISGRLDEARMYAENCLKAKDHSWMMNFGIDLDGYKKDIHEILWNTYEGLFNTEKLTPWGKTKENIQSFYRKIVYSCKAKIHRRLYEKYCLITADSLRREITNDIPLLDIAYQYYNSFKRYKYRAKIYFNFSRELETNLIPESENLYNAEEGMQYKNLPVLVKAVKELDPQWQRIKISNCYQTIAALNKPKAKKFVNQQAIAEELFSLNNSSLRQAGIKLPVQLNITINSNNYYSMQNAEKAMYKNLVRTLKNAGFDIKNTSMETRYKLQLNITGSRQASIAICELLDMQNNTQIFRNSLFLHNYSRSAICNFTRNLANIAFKIE
jgi:Tfp pilus assembly protein PilF